MLVLTRRIEEAVLLSNGVRIIVAEIRHGQVKLGIEAPPHIAIARDELVTGKKKGKPRREIKRIG